jgi:hypothetical protein
LRKDITKEKEQAFLLLLKSDFDFMRMMRKNKPRKMANN